MGASINPQLTWLRHPAWRGTGCIVFSIVHNEMEFMPAFLSHYRALDVAGFLFLDDHSTDGTAEFLSEQPDCAVLRTSMRYGDDWNGQRFGPKAKNLIPQKFLANRWVLTADADEFLLLPPPFATLPQWIDVLGQHQLKAMRVVMLDFYPQSLGCVDREKAGKSPFEFSTYFDVFSQFEWLDGEPRPRICSFTDGVRGRMFVELLRRRPELTAEFAEYRFASLNKVPLVHWTDGVRMRNAHHGNVRVPAKVQGVMAHFKLYPGLREKVVAAVSSGAYWRSSIEYRFLARAMEELIDWPLVGPTSRTYADPTSLEEAGWLYSRL